MRKDYECATNTMLTLARWYGKRHGYSAADTQYFPGGGRDTARDAAGRARAMLRDYDNDNPDWATPPDWLSGEWADNITCADVTHVCKVDSTRDPDGIAASEVCDAFIAAADAAYTNTILRHLRAVAQNEE